MDKKDSIDNRSWSKAHKSRYNFSKYDCILIMILIASLKPLSNDFY